MGVDHSGQFFLRTADADVEKYLKLLTFLPMTEIRETMQLHEQDQSQRVAQHKLAKEFVELIYGLDASSDAERQHRQLHNKNLSISDLKASVAETRATETLHPNTKVPMFAHPSLNKHATPLHREDDASTHVTLPRSLVVQRQMSQILWSAGLVRSNMEGKRLINAGGAYAGGAADARSQMDDSLSFSPIKGNKWEDNAKWVVDDSLLILRSGKWRIKIINIVPDEEYADLSLSAPGWEEHLQNQREQEEEKNQAV